MRCGPGGVGQCFGPDICCGATIGCHLKSRESAPCAAENSIPVSCEVGTPPCADGAGRCAADGLCCSEESCTVDESCRLSPASQTETARLADILRSLMPNGDGVSLSRHYGYQRR
ncbi:PREDICTED: neurophysin 2-like [Priapulus caudatus]|uniref:Neurophysin 2-like n=1 Tax=Priapulus caudatus TaxID=37621 RepID=A0ABM1EQ47_PRICU|nr:PREDICTED: neurophysin 2-like [Priapulus caudatus]